MTIDEENAAMIPAYYGGPEDPYEALKVIQAWNLNFCLGAVVKHIRRLGRKPGHEALLDLKKAREYLTREIEIREWQASAEVQAYEAARAKQPSLASGGGIRR